jgi:hypothetical protein
VGVLLVITPEYSNSIPGVLKHTIDWASRSSNMATTPLMLVGNKADARDIDPVAILAYTRADALSRHGPHRRKGSSMNAYRGHGPISMLLVFMIGAVSFAGERLPSQASSRPTIAGTYKLVSRTLPDGTRQFPPDIMGLMTYTKDHRTVNIMWKEPDGKLYALALGSTYTLTPSEYRETLLFVIENDQITGTGTNYDLMGGTRTAAVTVDGGRIQFKLPFDPPTVVFEGNTLTATAQSGIFAPPVPAPEGRVDVWEKIE